MGEEVETPQEEARARLWRLLAERSYQRRRVTLASGRTSDFYFDTKPTLLQGEGAFLAALLFCELLKSLAEYEQVKAVAGMELGAVPIGTAIAVVSYQQGRPLAHLVVRKEAKDHGTGAAIEGASLVSGGSTVVVIEDVVTTGGSSLAAVRRLREEGFHVRSLLALIDRQEGGREAIENEELLFRSLFVRSDFAG